jgi:hypothetical protein
MPRLIPSATRIPVPGNKQIEEYVGRVNTNDSAVSIAHMHSPSGWSEPGQQPEFDEYTVVLKGSLRVERRAANGCGIVRRARKALSTSRCVWTLSTLPRSIGTPDFSDLPRLL